MSRVALVVDDDPAVLDLLAEMLKDFGCEVITALNGTDALTGLVNDQRKDLKVILVSGRESDSHGLPLIRKAFLQDELERVMRRTTGLC